MSFYVIGIGGTGAKCIEAIVQLASVGLLPTNKLNILFVDADETNGNLNKTKNTLQYYQQCYQILKGQNQKSNWMTTNIKTYDAWSPFNQTNTDKTLGSFFTYQTIRETQPELANLFDVLYTEDERNVSLEVGFRGRPAIGSGIMTSMDLDSLTEEPWRSFINQIEQEVSGASTMMTRVLLCGSIFGGTGASGLPTIGRLISNKLETSGVRKSVKLGAIFALPYFSFPKTASKETVYATSDLFLLNTEAALRYYHEHAQQFDVKYLLGNQQFEKLGEFSVGKDTQKNKPHFIEFYAALAARNFFTNDPPDGVNTISRERIGTLEWKDLPDSSEVKRELTNATRFAFIWLSYFQEQLKAGKTRGIAELDSFSWFKNFFQGRGLFGSVTRKELPDLSSDGQQEMVERINNWSTNFLQWLVDIHDCESEAVNLLKAREHFANLNNLREENFAYLFHDDPRAKDFLQKDNLVTLQNALGEIDTNQFSKPNTGVAGLAKALYDYCKLR